MAETILGTIPNVADTKLFSRKNYNLIFTTDRLVGSLVTANSTKSTLKRTLGKDQSITASHEKNNRPISEIDLVKRFEQMQINDIISESKDNFSVSHNHVIKIIFKIDPKDKMTIIEANPPIEYFSWEIEISSMLINIELKSNPASHPQIIAIKDTLYKL